MSLALQKFLFGLYYPYCGLLGRLLPSITLDGRKLRVFPGVYKPLDSEQRIVDFIEPNKRVLDVGCGSGVITVFAAAKSAHVTAIDISPQAIENTQLNCRNHQLTNVEVLKSDMYSAVSGTFDYILSYPPLFQGSFASQDRQWCTSNHFVEELFRGAAQHLNEDGKLLVLLPGAFRQAPEELGQQYGLKLESATPHQARPLSVRIHSLPYLHFNANNHIFAFKKAPAPIPSSSAAVPGTVSVEH